MNLNETTTYHALALTAANGYAMMTAMPQTFKIIIGIGEKDGKPVSGALLKTMKVLGESEQEGRSLGVDIDDDKLIEAITHLVSCPDCSKDAADELGADKLTGICAIAASERRLAVLRFNTREEAAQKAEELAAMSGEERATFGEGTENSPALLTIEAEAAGALRYGLVSKMGEKMIYASNDGVADLTELSASALEAIEAARGLKAHSSDVDMAAVAKRSTFAPMPATVQ